MPFLPSFILIWGVFFFPKGICPKVNVIARLEYELAYYDPAVHRFNHYTMRTPRRGVLENKTNATSHPNIGLLKTAIEEEWNGMSEEFILKACKSFRRRLDSLILKMAAILIKFTVLCLSFILLFIF